MQIKKIILIIFLSFLLNSCIDEYIPDVDKYENLLVVDGLLKNDIDPISIKLSTSSKINFPELIPLSNAEVFISDENNIITSLTESEIGTYRPSNSLFIGEIGNSYQLHINLQNGKKYVSEICTLPQPINIDSIYAIPKYPEEIENGKYPGLQFYLENHKNTSDTTYFMWRLYQTYKFRSSFDIDYIFAGELISNPNATALRTCWHSSKINKLLVSSSLNYKPGIFNNTYPLNFVSTNSKALSIKYSLLVSQLTISAKTYEFYNQIQEQDEQIDNLWSQQPKQIKGNIYNIDDKNETVLGYFIVAGYHEKRIFVDRPNLPFYYSECEPDYDIRFLRFEPEENWPIYLDDIMFFGLALGRSKSCFDCRLSDGDTTKPSFWQD